MRRYPAKNRVPPIFCTVKAMKIRKKLTLENAEGYERARIPGMCLFGDSIITYCELRRSDSDWAVIDIGMRKSTDAGETWGERRILVSGGKEDTVNNPVMAYDGEVLHFLYCRNYNRVYYRKSCDMGESFSEEREITKEIKQGLGDFYFNCIALGPCHFTVLKSGRLLVPVWLSYNKTDEKSHHPSVIAVLYSDDKGESWKIGEINSQLNDPSEFSVAEDKNGNVTANIRHENPERCRAVAHIGENCEIRNIRFIKELIDPVCCAGFCSFNEGYLFSNCADENERIRLTVRSLSDDFSVRESLLINEEGGYSDIAFSAEKNEAYIIYEHGKHLDLCVVDIN